MTMEMYADIAPSLRDRAWPTSWSPSHAVTTSVLPDVDTSSRSGCGRPGIPAHGEEQARELLDRRATLERDHQPLRRPVGTREPALELPEVIQRVVDEPPKDLREGPGLALAVGPCHARVACDEDRRLLDQPCARGIEVGPRVTFPWRSVEAQRAVDPRGEPYLGARQVTKDLLARALCPVALGGQRAVGALMRGDAIRDLEQVGAGVREPPFRAREVRTA